MDAEAISASLYKLYSAGPVAPGVRLPMRRICCQERLASRIGTHSACRCAKRQAPRRNDGLTARVAVSFGEATPPSWHACSLPQPICIAAIPFLHDDTGHTLVATARHQLARMPITIRLSGQQTAKVPGAPQPIEPCTTQLTTAAGTSS